MLDLYSFFKKTIVWLGDYYGIVEYVSLELSLELSLEGLFRQHSTNATKHFILTTINNICHQTSTSFAVDKLFFVIP